MTEIQGLLGLIIFALIFIAVLLVIVVSRLGGILAEIESQTKLLEQVHPLIDPDERD